ncbi:hypothetical protein AM363_02850 (plasmid) [Citrobacter freundii]|uniref:Uncharacterized protein n=1 Tax=Citrobacter freundii TaxID=546 RepID=A0AB33H1S4_CITFR|nr:hypothetical protein [Citrobacter freundii]AXZ45977.1 hypothetical protein AM363_02850 [Citrobacter freundii]EKT9390058.1 hypothetical protein [Citrobacter freundii]EKU1809512.1 hypothetical protein [Citrobacter freundii]EKW3169713.1 hypothetical protein [Citrobacter freundii]EKX8167407.1 hypothetical protein [Citrobacter freundii]
MKAKEFLNSHQLVVISDFIKSIEDVPADKWLHDFMQEELAFLIKQGTTLANHDDYVSLDMVRSSTWLMAIYRAYSGSYPATLVQKPSDIIQEWSVKKEANQYTVTMGIAIDTSDAQAALAALEEQIQSSSALKVLSGAIRDGAEPYYGVATLCSTESSSIEQQTLSTVLGNTLHTVSSNMASSTAVELAQAVKTAFDVLDNKNATTR